MQNQFKNQKTLSKSDLSQWLLDPKTHFATPHGQRSYAYIKLNLSEATQFTLSHFIRLVESTLKTPVQSAVKREDEQEFARLSGQHLMFCEDAARTIKEILNHEPDVLDFWVKVEHQESLHAHNAVAVATKGLTNGYHANTTKG